MKDVLEVFILLIFNFVLKWGGFCLLALIPNFVEQDLSDKIIELIFINLFFVILYFIIGKCGNSKFIQYLKENSGKYTFKYLFWINFTIVLFLSDFINLFYPMFYYYLFKIFLSKFSLIRKFYLDYAFVKKYALIFFILESPLLLFILLVEIFDTSNEPNWWWGVYYFVSIFIFYFPIFIASWWDNRKIKCN